MGADEQRIGGRVPLKRAERVLGFQPEVGETFVAAGMKLRVLSRTIGIEGDDIGEEQWFDVLFVATVDPVNDVDAAGQRLKEAFGYAPAEDPVGGDRAENGGAGPGEEPAEEPADDPTLTLDDDVVKEIERILGADARDDDLHTDTDTDPDPGPEEPNGTGSPDGDEPTEESRDDGGPAAD